MRRGIRVDGPEIETLVLALKAGDEAAFTELCLQGLPLADYLSKRAGSRNPLKREDIREVARLGMVQAVAWSRDGRLHDLNIGALYERDHTQVHT